MRACSAASCSSVIVAAGVEVSSALSAACCCSISFRCCSILSAAPSLLFQPGLRLTVHSLVSLSLLLHLTCCCNFVSIVSKNDAISEKLMPASALAPCIVMFGGDCMLGENP